MPGWFMRQLERAFLEKNRQEIRVLNQCWFDYQYKQKDKNASRQYVNQR